VGRGSNRPIATSEWLNTVDFSAPTSKVAAFDPIETPSQFLASSSGSDQECGIAYLLFHCADNGGAYIPWLLKTTDLSDVFDETIGHAWDLYSIAADKVDKLEAVSAAAEATITLSSHCGLYPPEHNASAALPFVDMAPRNTDDFLRNSPMEQVAKLLHVPNLYIWPGSCVVVDPKGENDAKVS
jgi:hypothetical protein